MIDTSSAKRDITLKEFILKARGLLKYLWIKWYYILLAGILGAIFGFFYAQSQKQIFTATTTFVLESGDNSTGGMSQMAGLAALAGVNLNQSGGGIFQGENLFELYRSRKMIERTLLLSSPSDSSLLLLDRYFMLHNDKKRWKEQNPKLLQIDFRQRGKGDLLRARDSILQTVIKDINLNNLNVGKLDKKSGLIKIDVHSINETFSKEFNESLVSEVNRFYINTKTKKSLENIRILQYKTDSVRAIMNGDISIAASVGDATPNLNPTRLAQRLIPTQRSQFSAETNKAILAQLVQNLEMSKMSLLRESPLIEVVDEPIYPLPFIKLSRLKIALLVGIGAAFLCVGVLLGKKLFRHILS
ncbi:lipopolysaccharide biosynthesis protein [Sphingobacterium multivorum]|uniref:lipopolysaccharide biosynthesis protein n=1 Tax=Sphingobacterium multivorum TaxID=28454 RepID=UPI0028A11C4A|nr:lipopolysaccharide biosynthesis protein [Sphingobacterium multivorum]